MAHLNSQNFLKQAQDFLSQVFDEIEQKRLEIPDYWSIDHLCYRTESMQEYESTKKSFQDFSSLRSETIVNGRPIACFKLTQPFFFKDRWIDLVEVPAPKPGKQVSRGFEHLEFVCDERLEDLAVKYSHLELDRSGLQKKLNPELEIGLSKSSIKFHHMHLESLIRLEESHTVLKVIQNLEIMERLAPFHPLIVGTIPLGISLKDSDLDVVLGDASLEEIQKELLLLCQSYDGFKIEVSSEYLVANLRVGDLMIEFFAQNQNPLKQYGFRHFQIEERLLRIGGDAFRSNVLKMRHSGQKTEPAFASVLGLNGDPYQSLLSLQKQSDFELQKILFADGISS